MTDQVYSFVINSRDKVAGNNNTATYNLMFSILPREYKYYKVGFSFYTDPALFVDVINADNVTVDYSYENGKILTNLLLQNSTETDNSPSNLLGFITRSASTQNSTTSNHICYICADKGTNQEIVVLRPDVDQITLTIIQGTGSLAFVSTNTTGTRQSDLPNYMLHMQFTPVKDFHVS
jgi:hypothetical protein